MLSSAECEIFYAYEYENASISWHFHIYRQRNFHAQLSWAWKKFYNLGARTYFQMFQEFCLPA